MGFKDDLMQVMMGQGYDFMTSAEEVTRALKELQDKPPGVHQLYVGKAVISIKKEGKK